MPPIEIISVSALIEALPDALVVADSDGVIRLVNQQTELLFGRPRVDLLGTNVDEYVPRKVREIHSRHRAQYVMDPKIRPMGTGLQLAVLQKSGHEVAVEVNLSPLMAEGGMVIVVVLRRLVKPQAKQ